MKRKFLRQDSMRHFRIGKNTKKLQKWRKPKGRHSKMRQYRTGYPASVSIGYRKDKTIRGRIDGMRPVLVYNLHELDKVNASNNVIIGKVGAKKKLEIIRTAAEKGIKLVNVPWGGKKNAVK